MKASVRAQGIKFIGKSRGGLGASEEHGKRLDEASQRRIITKPHSINWSKAGDGRGLDLVDAFRIHKKEFGAVERAKAELGTHMIVNISPEWLAEIGDVHDPYNERIEKLIIEAKNWAESWQGKGAVFATRFDLDEKGSGVVDIFSAPVRAQGRRNGKKVMTVSPSMAKRELTRSTGEKTSGAAMQTSWSAWAQKRLDPRFERGLRKSETGRTHIHAEIYAKVAEAAKAKALKTAKKIEKEAYENARQITQETQERAEVIQIEVGALKSQIIAQEANLAHREAKIDQKLAEAKTIQAENRKARVEKITGWIEKDKHVQSARDELAMGKAALKNTKMEANKHLEAAKSKEITADEKIRQALNDINRAEERIDFYQQREKRAQEKLYKTEDEFELSKRRVQILETELNDEKYAHKETKTALSTFKAFFEFLKSTLKSLFPSQYEIIKTEVNTKWKTHPENPEREIEKPTYEPRSGFSP